MVEQLAEAASTALVEQLRACSGSHKNWNKNIYSLINLREQGILVDICKQFVQSSSSAEDIQARWARWINEQQWYKVQIPPVVFVLGLSQNINPSDLLICFAMGEQRLSEEQIAELKQVEEPSNKITPRNTEANFHPH